MIQSITVTLPSEPNLAGLAAISVPNGFGERGLPTGLQLVGRAFGEIPLIAIAKAYQQATDLHTRHPQLV